LAVVRLPEIEKKRKKRTKKLTHMVLRLLISIFQLLFKL